MSGLNPDRETLLQFAALMFKRADQTGFVSLRAFRDNDSRNEKPILIESIRLDDSDFAAIVFERARQAAAWDDPAVYCPPVATFKTTGNAKADNLHEGVDLSVECDHAPRDARSEAGSTARPATAIVESGGEWINPATGEIEPKVHLHWRLKKPTTTTEEHELLREARTLAAKLVGGDGTNKSVVHPIRWPGSWHRKKTPRLAKIVASDDTAEIDLLEAVEILRDASGAATFNGFGFKTEQQAQCRRSCGRSLRSLRHPEQRSALGRLEQDRNGHLGRYGGLRGGHRAFAEWSAKVVEERSGGDRGPLAALHEFAADEGRIWHAGLAGPQALAGMDVRKR